MLNRNTGMKYELAVAAHLARHWGVAGPRASSLEEELRADPRRPEVERLVDHLGTTPLAGELLRRLELGTVSDIELISQDDDTPGDLLFHSGRKRSLESSISVKYLTRVSRNPTGRLFVSEAFIEAKERELVERAVPEYVAEMTGGYGAPARWFRKRRTSRVASEFVAGVVREVARAWEAAPAYRRRHVVQECLQYGSKIAYLTVLLTREGRSYRILEGAREHHLLDVERVAIETPAGASQYVRFVHAREGALARMQVKFNNGILEPHRGDRPAPIVLADGTPCRPGRAFSSWNFQVTGDLS